MLRIITCVKQVPDTDKVRIDPVTGTLVRESVENVMNPDDRHAVEMSLSLRERFGGSITAISMGPMLASDALAEAYSLGADECVLVSDKRFAGSDSYVTAMILHRAISRMGGFDVLVTGVESSDGTTSSVPYQLAEWFDVPLVAQIHRIDIDGGCAVIERLYGHEYQNIQVPLPLILSVSRETNRVRFPSLSSIGAAFMKEVRVMTMDDIGGSENEYGLKGSPTVVVNSAQFTHARSKERIEGSLDEKVEGLIFRLKKHDILQY